MNKPDINQSTFGLAALLLLCATFSHAAELSRVETFEFELAAQQPLKIVNMVGAVDLRSSDNDKMRVEATVNASAKDKEKALELLESLRFVHKERTNHVELIANYPTEDYRNYFYRPDDARYNNRTSFRYQGKKISVTDKKKRGTADIHVNWIIFIPKHTSLEVDNAVGKVTAQSVSANLRLDTRSGTIEGHQGMGDLSADSGSGAIYITDHQGRVSVDTGSGSVTLQNIAGDVSADTGSGSISIEDLLGSLTADTGSGSITVSNANGEKMNLDTGSGYISVDNVSGSIIADTGSGAVMVRDLQAAKELSIDTGSGSVKIEGDLSHTLRLRVDTGSGGIHIETTGDPSMTLVAESNSGGIRIDLPNLSDVRANDGYFEAIVGTGDGDAELESGSGRISFVKKAP